MPVGRIRRPRAAEESAAGGAGTGAASRAIQSPAVAPLTPDQLRKRERAETVIRLMAPALNLLLAAGDRLSRIVEREDHEYYPARTRTGTEPPPSGSSEGARPPA